MSLFVDHLPGNILKLKGERAKLEREQHELRKDALSDIDTHEGCCESCTEKEAAEEEFDDAEVALMESPEWIELDEQIKALGTEIDRLTGYLKAHEKKEIIPNVG